MSLLLAILVTAAAGAAVPDDFAWHDLTFEDYAPTEFAPRPPHGMAIRSSNASSVIYRRLTPAEQDARHLGWAWRVDAGPPATSLASAPGDDRAIAIMVWFPTARRGLLGRLKGVMHRFAGLPFSGRMIAYTWGGAAPPETLIEDPFFKRDGTIVIRRSAAAPLGEWLQESVDVAADYARIYGEEPPPPGIIAIAADSDDTRSTIRARIRGLCFRIDDDCVNAADGR